MKNLLTYDEALELTWLVQKRFEAVWSIYVNSVNLREHFGNDYVNDYVESCRKDVFVIVGLLRKLRAIRLGLL